MAAHWTQAQIQTCLAKTVGNCKPYDLNAMADALARTPHVEEPDSAAGVGESNMTTIFPSSAPNP